MTPNNIIIIIIAIGVNNLVDDGPKLNARVCLTDATDKRTNGRMDAVADSSVGYL